jgi:putative membrane protein
MTATLPTENIAGALGSGLPILLLQFVICIVLLVAGVAVYTRVTPFRERELLREGNVAASTVFSGAVVALAIPLAALLATSDAILDIVVWGIVAILLQLVTVLIASHLMRGMRGMIEEGKVAAALPIVAAQLAIALLNAAAMVPV